MPPEDVLDILANPRSCLPSPGDHPVLTLRSPDTGSFLLAAIDPEAENPLVHLDQSVTSGRMLLPQEGIQLDKYDNHVVPILLRQHLPGQITLTTHVIQLSSGPPSADQIQKLQDPAYVSQLPTRRTIF